MTKPSLGNPAKTSRVAFELEELDWPGGPWVQLKVSHTDLEDEAMRESVSFGWPSTMSVMKTLVEAAERKAKSKAGQQRRVPSARRPRTSR